MRMVRPTGFDGIAALIPKYMGPGLVTNLSDVSSLRREELSFCATDGGLYILRRREGYSLLTFLIKGGPVPELPGTVVTELVTRPGDRGEAAELFEIAGFDKLLRRVRLTRPAGAADGPGKAVYKASPSELSEVDRLLRSSFDPLTGCLPSQDELCRDLAEGKVFAVSETGRLAGVLRASGRREIRQLCVGEPYRGKGYAGALVEAFLAENGNGRCSVWTGSENAAALAVYKKHGFSADGYTSTVFIKR